MFFGYRLFIGLMATAHDYDITLVQLRLIDLGTRLLKGELFQRNGDQTPKPSTRSPTRL